MPSKSFFSAFCLTALLTAFVRFATAQQPPSDPSQLLIEFKRSIGLSNSYILTCGFLPIPQSTLQIFGRLQVQIPDDFEDTIGRANSVEQCVRENSPRLANLCATDLNQFQQQGQSIFEGCTTETLTDEQQQQVQPFEFRSDNCRAIFSQFLQPRTAGVWACECVQTDTYFVVAGRGAFATSSVEELQTIDECTMEVQEQLDRVCQQLNGDFDLLALQSLQVCCRRALANTGRKTVCSLIVPDDVSLFKAPFQ